MTTAILLASGFSRRMGRDKLMLAYNNRPIVSYAIGAIRASHADKRVIVTNNPLVAALAQDFIHVPNPQAPEGRAAAIRAGVLAAADCRRYIFLVADQPFVTAEVIDGVLALSGQNPEKIIVCASAHGRGNPVLFPHSYRDRLLALQGDSGGRSLMDSGCVVEYTVPAKILFDVDDAGDYQSLNE